MKKTAKLKTEPTWNYRNTDDPRLTEDGLYWSDLLDMGIWDLGCYILEPDKRTDGDVRSYIQHSIHYADILLVNGEETCSEKDLVRELLRCLFPPLLSRDKGVSLGKRLDILSYALVTAKYGLPSDYFKTRSVKRNNNAQPNKPSVTWAYTDTEASPFREDAAYYTSLLGLDAWNITFALHVPGDCTVDGVIVGGINARKAERYGRIADIMLSTAETVCMEHVLVHELLHCVFPPIRDDPCGYWLHWLIELIARAIVIARYKLDLDFRGYRRKDETNATHQQTHT